MQASVRFSAALAAAVLALGLLGTGCGAGRDEGPSHEAAIYQCPMHPEVVSSEPDRCGICGMNLTPVEAEPAASSSDAAGSASHVTFEVDPRRSQTIGVTTERASYRHMHRTIRTVGRVTFAPELYAALADYSVVLGESTEPGDGARLLERRRGLAVRLRLLDLSFDQLGRIFDAGASLQSLILPGRSAWVYGRVYFGSDDLRLGQQVRVTAPGRPGRSYTGELVTIDPDTGTRGDSARVRALISTPGGGLRGEAFVRLAIEIPLGRRLVVPEDALLDTGARQIAFVRDGAGRFEPREVVIGAEGDGQIEVLAGLTAGEHVVTAANFLIDSESRFRAALAAYGALSAKESASSTEPVRPGRLDPADFDHDRVHGSGTHPASGS